MKLHVAVAVYVEDAPTRAEDNKGAAQPFGGHPCPL